MVSWSSVGKFVSSLSTSFSQERVSLSTPQPSLSLLPAMRTKRCCNWRSGRLETFLFSTLFLVQCLFRATASTSLLGPVLEAAVAASAENSGKAGQEFRDFFFKKPIETAFRPRVVLSPDCFAVVGEEGGYDDRNVAEAIRVGQTRAEMSGFSTLLPPFAQKAKREQDKWQILQKSNPINKKNGTMLTA